MGFLSTKLWNEVISAWADICYKKDQDMSQSNRNKCPLGNGQTQA